MDKDVIYKYGPFKGDNPVEFAGVPVFVGYQNNDLYIWCQLSHGYRSSKAIVVATGEEFIGRHIGTVITKHGLVWHVIEV